jgi:anti-sigma28 factor (negative regulator of flagellin synthesis)
MRLQLDTTTIGSGSIDRTAAEAPAGNHASQGSRPDDSGDRVTFSATSSALTKLSAVHAERLARLTHAVQNGTYDVASSALSSALIAGSNR